MNSEIKLGLYPMAKCYEFRDGENTENVGMGSIAPTECSCSEQDGYLNEKKC